MEGGREGEREGWREERGREGPEFKHRNPTDFPLNRSSLVLNTVGQGFNEREREKACVFVWVYVSILFYHA